MKKDLKIICAVLLFVQVLTSAWVLWQYITEDSGWGRFLWVVFRLMVAAWFAGLMVFTALVWLRGNEHTHKRDLYVLLITGTLTFFTVMITFGWIS